MLAVEIDLLTGRYGAGRFNDPAQPEWPPHPQRLFAALVAIWADADEPDAHEKAALEVFEALGPPQIVCSEASVRSPVTNYVPVNDAFVARDMSGIYEKHRLAQSKVSQAQCSSDSTTLNRALRDLDKITAKLAEDSQSATRPRRKESGDTAVDGLRVLPEKRGFQPRIYPMVVPDDPKVCFLWPDAEVGPEVQQRIDGLLARVHRIGHSATLVSCRLTEDPGDPILVADSGGSESLRVTGAGLLAELERAYVVHRGTEPRSLPTRYATYGRPVPKNAHGSSLWARDWILLKQIAGSNRPLHRAAELSAAIRQAIMKHAVDPVPEFISGHEPVTPGKDETPPLQRAHMSVLPLPLVGNQYADGAIRGFAVCLPAGVSTAERGQLYEALHRWDEAVPDRDGLLLVLGPGGALALEWDSAPSTLQTLRHATWSHPSKHWATVTPMALDRHPGNLRDNNQRRREKAEIEAASAVRASCGYANLPEPIEVDLDYGSFLRAVPPATAFPPFRSGSGPQRALVHAKLAFGVQVAGPIVLGSGRYRGMGLFKPYDPMMRQSP